MDANGGNMKMLGILKNQTLNLLHSSFNIKLLIFTTFSPFFIAGYQTCFSANSCCVM